MIEHDGRAKTALMPRVTLKAIVENIKDNVSIDASAIYSDAAPIVRRCPRMPKEWQSPGGQPRQTSGRAETSTRAPLTLLGPS